MELPSNKTIVFFSPHPDDETVSAGGLLSQLSKSNEVKVYFITNSPKGIARNIPDEEKVEIRKSEARKACNILGTSAIFLDFDSSELKLTRDKINLFKSLVEEDKPHIVITLGPQENHPTHKSTTKLVESAVSDFSSIKLWFGEVWNPIAIPSDVFYFNEKVMKIKLKAMMAYKSQMERNDWVSAIKSLNRFRAITSREVLGEFGSEYKPTKKYAEAFIFQ